MRNIKTEPTTATDDIYSMTPTRSNYRKATAEDAAIDVSMRDIGSSFASSFGRPAASDATRSSFNNTTTPRSDAPPPCELRPAFLGTKDDL